MLHNVNPTDHVVEQAFIAKVTHDNIAKAALSMGSMPRAPAHPLVKTRSLSREDLLRISREMRNAISFGNDKVLKSYGFSLAGIEYYLETRLGLEPGEANLMAHSLRHILESGAV